MLSTYFFYRISELIFKFVDVVDQMLLIMFTSLFYFFCLDRFRAILYRIIRHILRISTSEKSLCVRVCVLRVRGLDNFL